MTNPLPSPAQPLKIGTRGSPLALWQAHEVRRCLMAAFSLPETAFEIVVIKVTGDQILDKPLKEIGGKGLFTREIEEALIAGAIDIAVHSMKDMPVDQPQGLILDCYLPREDVRDAFVSLTAASISALPQGAVLGSSSLRRRAQIALRRPDRCCSGQGPSGGCPWGQAARQQPRPVRCGVVQRGCEMTL